MSLQDSSKNPVSTTFPGITVLGGSLRFTMAQSGSLGFGGRYLLR